MKSKLKIRGHLYEIEHLVKSGKSQSCHCIGPAITNGDLSRGLVINSRAGKCYIWYVTDALIICLMRQQLWASTMHHFTGMT